MPEASVLKLAEELLPRLRVAEWYDRAEAAKKLAGDIDLRDLRSVVAASDDPMVARDKGTRALADELRDLLRVRQEEELQLWFGDVDAALAIGRVIRALRLSSQPPKAGVPFPAEISQRLIDSANATLTPVETSERWIAVLEAAAFSPIHLLIAPMGLPAKISDDLAATVKRLAPAIPQVAALFGIEVEEGAPMPRPLRNNPAKERREKKAASNRQNKSQKPAKTSSQPKKEPAESETLEHDAEAAADSSAVPETSAAPESSAASNPPEDDAQESSQADASQEPPEEGADTSSPHDEVTSNASTSTEEGPSEESPDDA